MHPDQKKKLIRAFLMNKFPNSYQESWLNNAARYKGVDEALEYIEDWGTLNLNTLNNQPQSFGTLMAILDRSLQFSADIPPRCANVDEGVLDANMNLLSNFAYTLPPHLPNGNYSTRKTEKIRNQESPIAFANNDNLNNFKKLQVSTINTLLDLLAEKMPTLKLTSVDDLVAAIQASEKRLAKEKNQLNKTNLENELNLLKDLHKITQLSIINVPKEDGSNDLHCVLPDAAGGVTEKLSLISRDKVIAQMVNLYNNKAAIDFASYTANRDNYKLSTEGILKLPKHGKATEVQREAIALNIARILGFTTTKSTMVEHNGHPALFVPFDKIQLVKEYAKGQIQRIILPSSFSGITKIGDTYLHYSTVVPVGNQLNSDQMLEDFGDKMAFAYLCNDTDFIGMENQNKAIKDHRLLYIFDQVVMSDEKMELDSRLSLAPIGAARHSRHNQGRNRSIIEDSSFNKKFASVAELLNHQEKINFMLDNMFFTHFSKIAEIQASIKVITDKGDRAGLDEKQRLKTLNEQLKEVEALQDDVLKIKDSVNTRMQTMFRKFPTLDGAAMSPQLFLANQELLRQSLVLEKLVNKPVLFTDDGRPYKKPWTYRNLNKINAITKVGADRVELSFTTFNANQMISILRDAGVDPNLCRRKDNALIIPIAELNKIREKSIFPELRGFRTDVNYLDIERLKRNLSAYPEDNQSFLIARIKKYQTDLLKYQANPQKKIEIMHAALGAMAQARETGNPGMAKQVELNLQLDIQQKLRAMVLGAQPGLAAKVAQAFEEAVKLDRVEDINRVFMAYVFNGYKNTDKLDQYLDLCIQHGQNATDYKKAKTESAALRAESIELDNTLNKEPENSLVSVIVGLGAAENVDVDVDVDVEAHQEQRDQLAGLGAVQVSGPVDNTQSRVDNSAAVGTDADAERSTIKVG